MYDATVIDCMIDHFCCQCDALQEATTHANTLSELEAFKSSTEAFGFSQSLLAFADHDQALSQAIPAIPSLEAYLADANIDVTVATEGVMTAIKQTAQRFLDALLMHITKYKVWYGAALVIILGLGYYFVAMPALIAAISTSITAGHLTIPPSIIAILAGGLVGPVAYECIASVPQAIKESLELTLPTDVHTHAAYAITVGKIFKDRARIDITKLEASVHDHVNHGTHVTKTDIERVVEETKAAVEAIKRCDFIPERLEALAHSTEATTASGRAALLFITNLITKVMHLSVQETMKAAQAVRYIAHHAHHMAGHGEPEHHEPTPAA